ncbi:unnamed protein product [Malus baccata var. baccata]
MANREGGDLYPELWKACAGPLVDVPRVQERVLYFPQGHMEQLEASTPTNQELNQGIPQFNLPSKILCRVVNVSLLVKMINLISIAAEVFVESKTYVYMCTDRDGIVVLIDPDTLDQLDVPEDLFGKKAKYLQGPNF